MNPPGPYASNGALPSWYGERATPSDQLLDVRSYKDRSREAHYFQLGLMISVFWSEPMGNGSTRSGTVTPIGDTGRKVFSNVRRFIVIERNNLFCVCVPVTTYGNQGCKKRGINVQDHAIVADSRNEAQPLDGEPQLEKRPIFVDLFHPGDTLKPASRVNLRSPTTIHYNLAIRFLGQVNARYIPRLKQYLPNFGLSEREEHTEYHLSSSNQSQQTLFQSNQHQTGPSLQPPDPQSQYSPAIPRYSHGPNRSPLQQAQQPAYIDPRNQHASAQFLASPYHEARYAAAQHSRGQYPGDQAQQGYHGWN